jgi:hypothetical protein
MDFAALIVLCIVALLARGSQGSQGDSPRKKLISIPSYGTLTDTTLWYENRPIENSPDHKNNIMSKLVDLMWAKHHKYASECLSSPNCSFKLEVALLQYSFFERIFVINDYELALNSLTIAMCEWECQKDSGFRMSEKQCTRIFLCALHEAHEEMYPHPNPPYKRTVKDILNDHGVANILSMKEEVLTNRWAWAMNSRYREDMRKNIESQLYK